MAQSLICVHVCVCVCSMQDNWTAKAIKLCFLMSYHWNCFVSEEKRGVVWPLGRGRRVLTLFHSPAETTELSSAIRVSLDHRGTWQ